FNCYRSIAPAGLAYVAVLNFDNTTGTITNGLELVNSPGTSFISRGSGLAFSPNSSKLYICYLRRAYQYDLSLNTLTAILGSQTLVSGNASLTGDLKTGPDGRMYIAKSYSNSSLMPGYAAARSGLFYFQNPD